MKSCFYLLLTFVTACSHHHTDTRHHHHEKKSSSTDAPKPHAFRAYHGGKEYFFNTEEDLAKFKRESKKPECEVKGRGRDCPDGK
ncbi:MAG TPA: hypothetical protein VNJ01_05925 [Bacteriovoracaceae bacterium]|nr:hypothetical protein [Bacteriovoracaceae bacterium]